MPLTNSNEVIPGLVKAVLIMMLGNGLCQATPADIGAGDERALSPIEVTALRLTAPEMVPIEAQYSESTITSAKINELSRSPVTTVETLLNFEPSIFAYSDGPIGTRTNIFFRAFTSGEFAETFDGVALNDLFNASVTNQASNINNVLLTSANIDSVEVYRGINNPAVNSYNSLGGTIDYLPRQPTGKPETQLEASYGSFASNEVRAVANLGDIGGYKQVFTYERDQSNGWTPSTRDRNNNFYYSGNWSTDWGERLATYVVYNSNSGFSPFNMPVPLLEANGGYYQWPFSWTYEDDNDSNWITLVDYQLPFTERIAFRNKVFGGVNDYRRTSYSNPADQQSATQPYNLENDPSTSAFWLSNSAGPTYDPVAVFGSAAVGTQYHFYGYKSWQVGDSPSLTLTLPANTITLGGNYTYGSLHSREYWYGTYDMPNRIGYNDAWDEEDRRSLMAVYLQDEVALFGGALHITPGVKYVRASTSDHDAVGFYYPISGVVGDVEHFVSPTLGANFKILPDFAVYAAYGRNIKFPDITAYYGGFQTGANGNPAVVPVTGVKPEYVNDYELGARYHTGSLAVTFNVYRENFTDTFINSLNTTSGLTSVSNGGASRYQGEEVEVVSQLAATQIGKFEGHLTYSHNEAKFLSSFTTYAGVSVMAGQPLADVPKDLATIRLDWRQAGWYANVQARYVGLQYIDQYAAGTPTASTISPHTLVDLEAAKTIDLGGPFLHSLRLALSVDNVFNKYYFNEAYTDVDVNNNNFVRAVPGAPRIILGTVGVKF